MSADLPVITRRQAFDVLNRLAITPTLDEIVVPYSEAFRLTEEAHSVMRVLARTSRRAVLSGKTQEEISRRAGVAASTVSTVVDRLRRLGLIRTEGGDYSPSARRRSLLRYQLCWSPAMWLSQARWHQARIAIAAIHLDVPAAAVRERLRDGEADIRTLRVETGPPREPLQTLPIARSPRRPEGSRRLPT